MAWMTPTELKQQTGMTIDDAIVQNSIDAAVAIMQRYIFIRRFYQSRTQNVQQILSPSTANNPIRIFIGDKNADSQITKADINAYEIDSNFTEYDLNASISTFNYKYGVVNFSTPVPTTNNRILFIEYYEAITDLELILPMLKELCQLEAVNWMFQKIPFSILQTGIKQWTLNGVSVDFDQNAVKQVITDNLERSKKLYNMLIPLYVKKTPLQAPAMNRMTDFMTTLTFRTP